MRSRVKNRDLQIKAHNIFALSELSELLASCNEDDIPVIILKGASLLGTLYENDLSRPMYDLDLLAQRADLGKIDEKLLRLGYQRLSHNWGSHITYRKKGAVSIPVEVHWELINRSNPVQRYAFKIETEDFWEDLKPVKICGSRACEMSPENSLIYLSCHLMKEAFSHEKWLTDIDRFIRHYESEIDWEKVIDKTEKYGVKRSVYHALDRVHECYQTPSLTSVLTGIRPARGGRGSERVMKQHSGDDLLHRWRSLARQLSIIETSSERIRALIQLPFYLLKRSFMLRKEPEEILGRVMETVSGN
ncbi:nucleotidyltransferase family protein [Gemmatimonadota bacterium]